MEISCLHLQVGFNLVQMDAEVMCSSKCVHYVGQFKGVWPVGRLCIYVCMYVTCFLPP